VDDQLGMHDGRVAAAADAWLADPEDVGVYGRLVSAVRDRRVYLRTAHHRPSGVIDEVADDVPDDPGDDPGNDRHAVQPLGAWITGADPREILDRLRGARPRGQ